MDIMHYSGSLNMQRGDMLGIWSWSKALSMCYIHTQMSKCPQQAGLCFSSVQSTCWGSKKSKPMHISAPLMESPLRSAFLQIPFSTKKLRQLVPLILEYWDSATMPTLSLSAARAGWGVPLAKLVAFPDCNEEVPCIKRRLDPAALDADPCLAQKGKDLGWFLVSPDLGCCLAFILWGCHFLCDKIIITEQSWQVVFWCKQWANRQINKCWARHASPHIVLTYCKNNGATKWKRVVFWVMVSGYI